jgi:hypothetical protein
MVNKPVAARYKKLLFYTLALAGNDYWKSLNTKQV